MNQGLYAAASGIMAIEDRQTVIANNIANVSTAGFRRHQPVQQGFYGVFSRKMASPARYNRSVAPGGGARVVGSFTDMRSGGLQVTGDAQHVALSGPGYLVVDTPQGERYTRNGHLAIDGEGNLATADGYKVQGAGGPIAAKAGNLVVHEDGTVMVDGVSAGQLRVVEFENPRQLVREDRGLYRALHSATQGASPAAETRVIHRSLEMSNVNLPNEMISLILGLRAYGANQKVLNAVDESFSSLIEQVGMPM